jgi:DNA-binding response OmpR family regulator
MISDSVYVVDDAQAARDEISMALKKNYHVKAFSSAGSAIEAMSSAPPDLVPLDIGLPGMSGIEALEHIKRLYPEMIVIMMSAYDDEKIVVFAFGVGANDYLIKPLQMDILLETIQNALRKATK